MGTVKYKLSSKINGRGESQIFIDILSDRDTHYRLKSGVFVSPENYDRLVRSDRILSLEWFSRFDELIREALPCDKERAQRIMEQARGTGEDILGVYDEFVSRRIIEKGLTSGTQELYHSVRRLLSDYLEGRPVSVKMIDVVFLNGLIRMMTDKGLSNVTQQNYFRVMKVFLKHLEKQGMIDGRVLQYEPKFRQGVNDVVYLTKDELMTLMELDLKGKDRIVRDLFVIQCMTGMRYSDMENLKKENIRSDWNGDYISILTKKTNRRLKIYLNSNVRDILKEYDRNIPWLDKYVVNYRLPRICRRAGMEEEYEIIRYIGSRRVVEHRKKWELIRTHCARRTFISLSIQNNVSTSVIMAITGHRQLSSFERYVGIGDGKKSDTVSRLEIHRELTEEQIRNVEKSLEG